MGNTTTSIGRGPDSGGNENHDGDPTRETLGETVGQEAPAGRDPADGSPAMPAGVPGAPAQPVIRQAGKAWPDGPNVEDSPWELEAARGRPPRQGHAGEGAAGRDSGQPGRKE